MPSSASTFDIYIDSNSPIQSTPPKSQIEIKIQPLITKWYTELLREINPNFVRPIDST